MNPSLQKAALLLSCLPSAEAEGLLKRLPVRAAEAVRCVDVRQPQLQAQRWTAAKEFVVDLSSEARDSSLEAHC